MTWTAQQLIADLRALDPDTEIYLWPLGPERDLVQQVTGLRTSWPARARRVCRQRIIRLRVYPRAGVERRGIAYIQGEQL